MYTLPRRIGILQTSIDGEGARIAKAAGFRKVSLPAGMYDSPRAAARRLYQEWFEWGERDNRSHARNLAVLLREEQDIEVEAHDEILFTLEEAPLTGDVLVTLWSRDGRFNKGRPPGVQWISE